MSEPNDLSAFWMPFSDNRGFKANPRMFVGAEGMHYTAAAGHKVLDATGGLWCVNAGHSRPEIVEAIRKTAGEMDFAPTFQLGHPLAFEAASRLALIMPEGLDRIFFVNSGSESVDTALKIALAYQKARGQAGRYRFIGRERAYHGVGFGGISVGGIVGNRRPYPTLLPGVDHLRHTHDPARNSFTRGQPLHGAELADDLERLIALHGAETIAAVIVEPVSGSTGVLVPPVGYLKRLREICDRHDLLLIFDEVITAFGRVGKATASERFGVTPDIITMAKGLTNASVPMGAVAVRREVYDTIVNSAAPGTIDLFHGYTYSGHPLASAAAIATLGIYEREGLFEKAIELEDYWADGVHSLKGTRHVIDCRNIGLIGGIELASRPDAPGRRAMDVFHRAFDSGLLIRVTGDIIALSPPLILEKSHIDEIFGKLAEVLAQVE
ncbi:omega amino acid--pyruvate aminotransferase [Erythrobacter sp. SG61-1L]|uniref:aspartate aminotransferase family protein n=1 Tax=Erythrobacter sp. SG61-1L TaxID=1603897 RepID=UPI0006C90798|nr:aspartate aminotransferase family protein [Erythrobacter sp. SG61-1L]KPL68319.1 omega amino acid--pyruvate aminotransferase [Erythrobacter sp. SG61-1L]